MTSGRRENFNIHLQQKKNKLNSHFKFVHYLGSGSFGHVYSGIHHQTDRPVAIKVESKDNDRRAPSHLWLELQIYRGYLSKTKGFPIVSHFLQTSNNNYLVMSLLGHNLENLFQKCDRLLSLKTLLQISIQVNN